MPDRRAAAIFKYLKYVRGEAASDELVFATEPTAEY